MTLLLVRHAFAGDSEAWQGDDRLRPLDSKGRRQAEALVALLAEFDVDRVVSSPYVRCIQTVEPLARSRELEIEHDAALGADRPDDVPSVLERLRGQDAAVCTHGDLPLLGSRPFKKGSVWVLDEAGEPARYLPPAA
ncbi:MAG: histidine phosphatase family protein [Actinobacteria bacterium]|nr:histidine phosphatase family protein [Actinomycetota bacterium]